MQSRTSFFNKTVFRKNLTRFAPVWALYGIVLLVVLLGSGNSSLAYEQISFAWTMQEYIQVTAIFNAAYGPLVAALLWNDLYRGRMCNMLHAMPLRRESWFVTHFLSGLCFSLIPTLATMLVSIPMLEATLYENAWQIGLLWYAAANLQFVCLYGMSTFVAMCVGNLVTLAAGYGLLQVGALLVWWVVDTVYTPMLYGVITPDRWANYLTPVLQMGSASYLELEGRADLVAKYGEDLTGVVGTWHLTQSWGILFLWAAVGLAFALAALLLYRKRKLEAAGDAVAFRALVPVFQVLCTLFVTVAPYFLLRNLFGVGYDNASKWIVLAISLVVGWFVGKMFLERSTHVFRLKNWYGLAPLTLVLVLSLVGTHFDVLGIEDRMPAEDQVEHVVVHSNYSSRARVYDIEGVQWLHSLLLADQSGEGVTLQLQSDGTWENFDATQEQYDWDATGQAQYRYSVPLYLTYNLDNGGTVERLYYVWVDSEAGQLANTYLSSWECVSEQNYYLTADGQSQLEVVLEHFTALEAPTFSTEEMPPETQTLEAAYSFLEAVKADCAEGHMNPHPAFHTGSFRVYDKKYEKGYTDYASIRIHLYGKEHTWSVSVFADSAHTIQWLEQYDLLGDKVISQEPIRMW